MEVSTEHTLDEILAELDRLMENGDWCRARDVARIRVLQPKYAASALTWFMRAQTHYVYGHYEYVREAYDKARECADYTPEAEYEFLCKWAMLWCRSPLRHYGDVKRALGYMNDASWLCGDDKNRVYRVSSLHARISLRSAIDSGHRADFYRDAYHSAKSADEGWCELGTAADAERMATNRLYLLLGAMMCGDAVAARELVVHIIETDDDADRRIATLRIGTALSRDDAARRTACEEVLLMF